MNKGSILILTLWVLTLMSLIAVAVSRQSILEYKLAGYALQESELRRKTEEAVWKAWAGVANDRNEYDSLEELWAKSPEEEGEGLVDEDRKVVIVVSAQEGTEVITIPESPLLDSIALGASTKIIEWLEKNHWQGVTNEVELQMAGVDISSLTVYADEKRQVNINTVSLDLLQKIIGYEAEIADVENSVISSEDFINPVAELKQAAENYRPFVELSQWFELIPELTGEELTAYQALEARLEERFKVTSQFFRLERTFSSSKITKKLTVVFKKGDSRPDVQFWHEERVTENH
jgi:hypothetical protein